MKQNCNTSVTVKGECCVNNPIFTTRMPISVTEIGHCKANGDFFLEREDGGYYTLVITVSGEGKLIYKTDSFSVSRKSAFLLDTNYYHRIETVGENWEFYYFDLKGPAMENYTLLCEEMGTVVGIPEKQGELLLLVEQCVKLVKEKKHYRDIQLSLNVTEMITKLLMSNIKDMEMSVSEKHQIAERAVEYITEHYDREIGVEEIAGYVSLSKYYFIKLFKNCIGVTPYEYLLHIRINAAKDLLRESDLTLEEIAIKAGFGDAVGFSRSFRRYVGLTPIAFRKAALGYKGNTE